MQRLFALSLAIPLLLATAGAPSPAPDPRIDAPAGQPTLHAAAPVAQQHDPRFADLASTPRQLDDRAAVLRAPLPDTLDELLEGSPITLIEGGKVIQENLDREMMSESELMVVAHRQGFEHLDDIDRCVLEPGGNFAMYHRHPTDDEQRFQALMDKIEELAGDVRSLKAGAS